MTTRSRPCPGRWPRLSPEPAEGVTSLDAQGAAAIGLDVFVPETPDAYDRKPGLGGGALGLAAARSGKVVLPVTLGDDGRLIRPLRSWQTVDTFGLIEVTEDRDRFVRRQHLAATVGERSFDSFALALLDVAGRAKAVAGGLQVDGRAVPEDADGCVRINFVGPPGTIRHVPFRVVLTAARQGGPAPAEFKGAIVIIGAGAEPGRLARHALCQRHLAMALARPAGPDVRAGVAGEHRRHPGRRVVHHHPALAVAATALRADRPRLRRRLRAAEPLARGVGRLRLSLRLEGSGPRRVRPGLVAGRDGGGAGDEWTLLCGHVRPSLAVAPADVRRRQERGGRPPWRTTPATFTGRAINVW